MKNLAPFAPLCVLLAAAAAVGQPLSSADRQLLQRLVLAEAQGEGELGMALVARSVLNRVALVRAGKLQAGTYLARSGSVRDVVYARNQYEPVRNGSLDRGRSAAALAQADRAITLALDTERLQRSLAGAGLDAGAVRRLLSATGFRTRSAFRDSSQSYDRQPFKNHVFNADAFSRNHDVPALFQRYAPAAQQARPSQPQPARAQSARAQSARAQPARAESAVAAPTKGIAGRLRGEPATLPASAPRAAAAEEQAREGAGASTSEEPGAVGRERGLYDVPEEERIYPRRRARLPWEQPLRPLRANEAQPSAREVRAESSLAPSEVRPAPSAVPPARSQALRARRSQASRPEPEDARPPAQTGRLHEARGTLADYVGGGQVLSFGARGPAVQDLQRQLGVGPTGLFGPTTQQALQDWQRSRGLEPTGQVGPTTLARLQVEARRPKGRVLNRGHRVSDPVLRRALERISAVAGKPVVLTSGDRNYVPSGGSHRSLHMANRAADFYVEGLTLQQAFDLIRRNRGEVLVGGGFELILHGPHTQTTGPHLHLGHRYQSSHRILFENGRGYQAVD